MACIFPQYGINNIGKDRVNFNRKWVDLEPTLDQKTYDTFYRPINVSWNIDWDGSSNCRLYKESITGRYVTVYYIIPWLLFPPTGWLIEKSRKSAF